MKVNLVPPVSHIITTFSKKASFDSEQYARCVYLPPGVRARADFIRRSNYLVASKDRFETSLIDQAMCPKRSVETRFSIHGFHFCLCINEEFHLPNEDCVFKYCFAKCVPLHGIDCPAISSLSMLAGLVKPRGNQI